MRLLLEVISPHANSMGNNRRKIIGPEGARIGRAPTNDWIISDDYVSWYQATVRYLNCLFFIEGKGRNPIAINDRRRPLKNDDPQLLSDGDHVFLDEYEITVHIGEEAAIAAAPSVGAPESSNGRPMGLDDPLDVFSPIQSTPTDDILNLLPDGERRAPATDELSTSHRPGIFDNSVEPLVGTTKDNVAITNDWFRTRVQTPSPPVKTTPQKVPGPAPVVVKRAPEQPPAPKPVAERPTAAQAATFEQVLAGAGIDPTKYRIDDRVALQFGEVLRIVVAGTMDTLRARAEIKYRFSLPETRIKEKDNNPLKFSANVDDALENLLLKQSAAFLSTPEAFRDAFDEIRCHQLAMLAGLQAGMQAMLAIFDPESLSKRFGRATPRAMLPLAGAKTRYWEQFTEFYRELNEDPDDAFSRLFGKAFAKKYEDELSHLKAMARSQASKGRS